MAIKALGWMLRIHGAPVYCYHEIVHNKDVVERFRRAGVVFVDDPDDVPHGAPLMLSAHGSAPDVVQRSRAGDRIVVDAVCPLVTKVHHEAKVRARKGLQIIYVGHRGHDEAIGTLAEAPASMHLVETVDDLERLDIDPDVEVGLLAQTTLAHSEWAGVLERARELHPGLWMPDRSDLCFATTNRQAAVKRLAPSVDLLLVIGSENSSNTQALVRTAVGAGARTALRIDGPDDIDDDMLESVEVVGLTAGASAPEGVVRAVVERLAPQEVQSLSVTSEDEYFPLPRELRDRIRSLVSLIAFSMGVAVSSGPGDRTDRDMPAAGVLDALPFRGSQLPAGEPPMSSATAPS